MWDEMDGESGENEKRKTKEDGGYWLDGNLGSFLPDGLAAEFELVTQALWTDPADQSGWLYHRWLIGDGEHDSLALRPCTTMLIACLLQDPISMFLRGR
jgi:hypothetical protein